MFFFIEDDAQQKSPKADVDFLFLFFYNIMPKLLLQASHPPSLAILKLVAFL